MAATVLDQVRRLIAQLSTREQALLLASLALLMAEAVEAVPSPEAAGRPIALDPWDEFLRLGNAVAAADSPGSGTLTAGVLTSRR